MLKRFIFLFVLIGIFAISFICEVSSYAMDVRFAENFTLMFDGKVKQTVNPVLYYKNTVMVPIKEVIQMSGIDVASDNFKWIPSENSLTINQNGTVFKFFNKKRNGLLEDKPVKIQYLPFIYDGTMYMSYVDIAKNMNWAAVYETSIKVIAFCHSDIFWENKVYLKKIQSKLDSQAGLKVDIVFDYGDENMIFNFKVDNENRLLNGQLLVNKILENRYITEKSELFIKGEDLFVKDYKINKWRLDQAANFDVASSFLKVFSSQFMLNFENLANVTFNVRKTFKGLSFNNAIPFNSYLRNEMGFTDNKKFDFKMVVNDNDYAIRKIAVMSATNVGDDFTNSRMDVIFGDYGEQINMDVPKNYEFAYKNVDDFIKMNAIKKALVLFLFDADLDAVSSIEKCTNVNDLIIMLQKPIDIKSDNQIVTYGPYLSNLMGGTQADAAIYKPTDQDMRGYEIIIEKNTKTVNIDFSYEDSIKLK